MYARTSDVFMQWVRQFWRTRHHGGSGNGDELQTLLKDCLRREQLTVDRMKKLDQSVAELAFKLDQSMEEWEVKTNEQDKRLDQLNETIEQLKNLDHPMASAT